jgi:uncharacterized protein YcbK (DUF882 family)
MGDGSVAVVNAHTGERGTFRYRREDGTYDADVLKRLARLFRSRGDGAEIDVSLRLVEVLSRVQAMAKVPELTLMSGYRSPDYNQDLKRQGRKVAGGSMHMEGLAADLAFPRPVLRGLWMQVRAFDCCGAGYYAKEGFLHVDVGRSRFWEAATSRVDENLSAGNARVFARTEFDRYERGEPIRVRVHALTVPPVRIARTARLVADGATLLEVRLRGDGDGCVEVPASGGEVNLAAFDVPARGHLELTTCEPRVEKTPVTVESNVLEITSP